MNIIAVLQNDENPVGSGDYSVDSVTKGEVPAENEKEETTDKPCDNDKTCNLTKNELGNEKLNVMKKMNGNVDENENVCSINETSLKETAEVCGR